MNRLENLFKQNRKWAEAIIKEQPDFFEQLSKQQAPEYLWIGCSDSRVPANEILGLMPGEIFVHRNVANMVVHTDLNCLSVIQYAVEVLKVKHIIVCGHYGCGGVLAAVRNDKFGLIDNWLLHIQDAQQKHQEVLAPIKDEETRHQFMCELNVLEQMLNVCKTNSVVDSWKAGQDLSVHGWIYGLSDGLLHSLSNCFSSDEDMMPNYNAAISGISERISQSIEQSA